MGNWAKMPYQVERLMPRQTALKILATARIGRYFVGKNADSSFAGSKAVSACCLLTERGYVVIGCGG